MFKQDFKYYKSRKPAPSFEDVLNLKHPNNYKVTSVSPKNTSKTFFGLKPIERWNVYEIVDRPGSIVRLLLINNPFTSLGQRYWVTRCLKDYSKKPNKTNLDSHDIIPENVDWWDYSQNNINAGVLKKLRWATLGYHHNWDTKVYAEDMKGNFPKDLSSLCSYLTKSLGFDNFNAEAAIVNYYHLDSTLSGHTDHSEQNLDAPLISLSFGQTALFLIGGHTIDVKPTAIFLHSGDVVIMSKAARLAYHGVPRIIQSNDSSWDISPEDCSGNFVNVEKDNLRICYDKTLWGPFEQYLRSSRININVRQVLHQGQLALD
ncbi:alkylated dna repair protein alkb-related [Holotrichia oblita]|uniref:Alkylated dna repair protein alkb-related n=1 Tax=Holotrichia oblita TaxID=644536 RepID=A0ACB9TAQ7_HOLOL|nr:alkylated dna repair protein alkb-related [Holotrichia oblita]